MTGRGPTINHGGQADLPALKARGRFAAAVRWERELLGVHNWILFDPAAPSFPPPRRRPRRSSQHRCPFRSGPAPTRSRLLIRKESRPPPHPLPASPALAHPPCRCGTRTRNRRGNRGTLSPRIVSRPLRRQGQVLMLSVSPRQHDVSSPGGEGMTRAAGHHATPRPCPLRPLPFCPGWRGPREAVPHICWALECWVSPFSPDFSLSG